jgi:hypothetical protein
VISVDSAVAATATTAITASSSFSLKGVAKAPLHSTATAAVAAVVATALEWRISFAKRRLMFILGLQSPARCAMAPQALAITINAKAAVASINQALHHLWSVNTAATKPVELEQHCFVAAAD